VAWFNFKLSALINRILAIGDIHGCHAALTRLLELVAPQAGDTLVFLGDYIDRGPASREVIESLIALSHRHHTVFLRGNHEVMILDSRNDALKANLWGSVGGFEALISYDAAYEPDWASRIPESHWKFLNDTRRYFETANHIFVHGCLDAEKDLEAQSDTTLYWERVDTMNPHKSGKQVVCGHTPQSSGKILDLGYAICIDTGAVNHGWLTCLDAVSKQWWQANERRETRTGTLA